MSWTVEGTYFENCNCDFACPCTVTSFAAPATQDRCQVVLAYHIQRGEIDGTPAAAISLTDGRLVSDPFRATGQLTQLLRMRASALHAVAKTPALRDRLRAGVRVSGQWRPAAKAA